MIIIQKNNNFLLFLACGCFFCFFHSSYIIKRKSSTKIKQNITRNLTGKKICFCL